MATEAISTLGVTLKYCVETTAGTRPTGSSATYTNIENVISIGEINAEPSSLDCTPLSATSFKSYIPGLKDVGSVAIGANVSDTFVTAWDTLCTAAEALTGGKQVWFEVAFPNMTDKFYFRGMPTDLGLGSTEVDAVAQVDAYITISDVAGYVSASA